MPIYDTETFNLAGIQPTRKMQKYSNAIDQNGNAITPNLQKFNLNYDNIYRIIREHSMIEVIERYAHVAIPFGLTQDIFERILYFRGKGVLYYNYNVDKFQFLPFALNGQIDEYGRYLKCNSLPFIGVDEYDMDGKPLGIKKQNKKDVKVICEDIKIVYDFPVDGEEYEYMVKRQPIGIIINDNSLGLSQQPIIRSAYSNAVLHSMATLWVIINTAMFGAADVNLLQVENESELDSINNQIDAINASIMKGQRFIPISGKLPITPIKTTNTYDIEGLFNTFNSLSNFLKSINGIANPGIFDKKAHLLQEEQELNGSNADEIYYNGLRNRQEAALLFQAWYHFPYYVESKREMSVEQQQEAIMGGDTRYDDTQKQSTGGNNGSDNT